MVTDISLADFLDVVEQHRLLTSAQLDAARGLGGEPKKLAAELIKRGWLTPLQANRILQGRGDSLVLGPYMLLEQLGQGGMGRVFKARHTLMDRIVALKIIRGDGLEQPEALTRFRREIQAAAMLTHPNVVLAHDAALAGDRYYLAMEFVEGTDLARLVKQRGKLPPAQACRYVRQAALGLEHACERGLVHRDIKPSNLMLAADGDVVKVLDLGIARLRTHLDLDATASALTQEGAVMGTPDYIAPEQAVDSRTADIRADIYSLGCTLYYLLTGQPPFPGGSLTEKLLRHQQQEPEPIEHLCPDAPAELVSVVHKMMAKRPEDRYQIPQQVADVLAPFAGEASAPSVGGSTTVTPPETITASASSEVTQTAASMPKPAPARRRSSCLLVTAIAAVLLLALTAVGGAVGVLGFLLLAAAPVRDEGDQQPMADEPRIVEAKQRAREPGGEPEHGAPQGAAPLGAAPQGAVPLAVEKLANMPAAGTAKLVADLTGHTATVQCLAFTPDGTRLASGSDDHQVRLWDGRTGKAEGTPLRHSEAVRALAFSADGKRLAVASAGLGAAGAVKVWNLTAKPEAQSLPWADRVGVPMATHATSLAFASDGKRLAAGGGPVQIWDLTKSGKDAKPAVFGWQKTFPSYIYAIAFAPDGKSVAAGCHEQGDNVRIWALDDPAEPTLLQGKPKAFGLSHADVRGVVAYVAGGKRLVRITSDGVGPGFSKPAATVMLWDVDAKEQKITLRDTLKIPGGAVFALTSAADGKLRIAAAAGNPGLGAGLRLEPAPPTDVAIWDEATGTTRTFATGHKQHVTALAFSPDGARLATGSADQSAKLWDLTR